MGCLISLLPFAGIAGLYFDIPWLFYVAGGISAIMDISSIIGGTLNLRPLIVTIVSMIGACIYTHSIIDGIILGSCASYIIMLLMPLLTIVFLPIIGLFQGRDR